MVGEHVLQRCDLSRPIERVSLVGNRVEQDSAAAQLAKVVLDCRDRILAMLEEVVGDDEVLRAVLNRRQDLTVVDDVRFDKRAVGELGVVPAQLRHGQTVDVPDPHITGHRQWKVECADLETLPEQVMRGKFASPVEINGRSRLLPLQGRLLGSEELAHRRDTTGTTSCELWLSVSGCRLDSSWNRSCHRPCPWRPPGTPWPCRRPRRPFLAS